MYKKYRKGVFIVLYTKPPISYLLLHRKLHWKGWEFPKGGSLAKERVENTVVRELREEVGLRALDCKRFPVRGRFSYDKKTQRERKAVGFAWVLFACLIKRGKVRISKREHDGYRWCSYGQARKLLSWQNQKRCLKLVNDYLSRKRQL